MAGFPGFPDKLKPKPGYEDITWEDKNWGEYIGAIGERMEENERAAASPAPASPAPENEKISGAPARKGTTAGASLATKSDRMRRANRGFASSILTRRSGLASGPQSGADTLG